MDSAGPLEMPSLATQTPPRPDEQVPDSDVSQSGQIPALEPRTLPTHPLRADDVSCFLPKLIG